MHASQGSELFRVAQLRIDQLYAHLSARGTRDLDRCLDGIGNELDALLLGDRGGHRSGIQDQVVEARIGRLSRYCAVLEEISATTHLSVATNQALLAVVEACADVATWIMEMPPSAPAWVA